MRNNIGEARRLYSESVGKNVTQDIAATFFNVSPSGYRKWEQGAGKLNGEILCAIADKYGCSTDFLLCRTDDPTPYPARSGELVRDGDETRMVESFRKCTPREKLALINTAETMADGGLAKNREVRSYGEGIA